MLEPSNMDFGAVRQVLKDNLVSRPAGIKSWILLILPALGTCIFILLTPGSFVQFSKNDCMCGLNSLSPSGSQLEQVL